MLWSVNFLVVIQSNFLSFKARKFERFANTTLTFNAHHMMGKTVLLQLHENTNYCYYSAERDFLFFVLLLPVFSTQSIPLHINSKFI